MRNAWQTFREWPTWTQGTLVVAVVVIVGGIALSGSLKKNSDPAKAGAVSPKAQARKAKAAAKAAGCRPLAPVARAALEQSIEGKPSLTDARYLTATSQGAKDYFARGGGLHLVAAAHGEQELVWATDARWTRTGSGRIVGLDPHARTESKLGAGVTLGTAGVTMSTPGVSDVLDCKVP